MNAKKLPSGSWRVQVYSHTENGKRVYESITAPTRYEAELKAAEFKTKKKRKLRHDLTVSEAGEGYIKAKEGVLSPSTIAVYKKIPGRYYGVIGKKKIKSLTSEDMQLFISDLSTKVGPKTVRNAWGLLASSIALYDPDMHFRVTLPAKKVKRSVCPSDEAVRALLDNAREPLRTAILLGMRSMRRGEICALKYEDIKDGVAHIHADMIKGPDGWVYKEIPKTSESDRFVRVPDLGEGEGYIVKWSPDYITKEFIRLRDSLGLSVRFHDLRHYFASTAAVLNIPDIYTADMGGWSKSSGIMKEVYQNKVVSLADHYQSMIEDHLEKVSHEVSHGK
jgi:integrase